MLFHFAQYQIKLGAQVVIASKPPTNFDKLYLNDTTIKKFTKKIKPPCIIVPRPVLFCQEAVHLGEEQKVHQQFAKRHISRTSTNWTKVLWSDESKFCLFRSAGRIYVKRPIGKRDDHRYQKPAVKFGGGSIMVWGCLSRYRMGPIVRVDGKMTGLIYREILENNMLGQARDRMPAGWLFQQDNDPKRKSKIASQWLKD